MAENKPKTEMTVESKDLDGNDKNVLVSVKKHEPDNVPR